MFKKLFRGIFTAFGMLVGYELFALFNFLAAEEAKTNPDYTSLFLESYFTVLLRPWEKQAIRWLII